MVLWVIGLANSSNRAVEGQKFLKKACQTVINKSNVFVLFLFFFLTFLFCHRNKVSHFRGHFLFLSGVDPKTCYYVFVFSSSNEVSLNKSTLGRLFADYDKDVRPSKGSKFFLWLFNNGLESKALPQSPWYSCVRWRNSFPNEVGIILRSYNKQKP